VAPESTVTVVGTDAALELEDSETSAPPEGADAVSVTVPITLPPLDTELAASITPWTAVVTFVPGGVTVRFACAEVPP
jgi:hypothetical protein